MATVLISIGQAGKNGQGSSAPVIHVPPRASQSITSSGSNQVSTVSMFKGEVAIISASGGAVAIAAGASPDAAISPQYIVGDGGAFAFEAISDGLTVAVVDA